MVLNVCKFSDTMVLIFAKTLTLLVTIADRDHSSITSAKKWVGGVRKWQFLLIYSTIYADVGGPKKAKNMLT